MSTMGSCPSGIAGPASGLPGVPGTRARSCVRRSLQMAVWLRQAAKVARFSSGRLPGPILTSSLVQFQPHCTPDGKRSGTILGRYRADIAFSAIAALARQPADGCRVLGPRMKAIPQVAPEVFSRLIQKIDADSFEEREMACKGLLQFGKMSLPSLQKALRDGLSVEATRRAREVLEKIIEERLCPADLRAIRAIEALEYGNCPESIRQLRHLATGDPNAMVTREARSALERLSAAK